MIYASEKGTKIILIAFLLSFSFLIIYFVGEMKKIESIYDNISYDINLE